MPPAPPFARSAPTLPEGCAHSLGLSSFPRPLGHRMIGCSGHRCSAAARLVLDPRSLLQSGFGRRGDDPVCAREMWDPYPLLVSLVVVEPTDPHIYEVVSGALPAGEQCLGARTQMLVAQCRKRATAKGGFWVEALEVPPEGAYQVMGGHAVIDVLCPP